VSVASLMAIKYGPCETETCCVVVEDGYEIGVLKWGTTREAALKTVSMYILSHN
jgi:hypothetical protein